MGKSPCAVAVLILAASACGPIQSTGGIVRAQAELTAARTAGADQHTPFELTAAEAYLSKAREEASRASLERAAKLANKAWTCARVARLVSEARTAHPNDDVRPEHYAGEAVCRPGPTRDVPLAHLEPAALGVAPPSQEPADPPPVSPVPAPTRRPIEAPPPVAKPPPPLPDGDLPPGEDAPLPEGDIPEGDG